MRSYTSADTDAFTAEVTAPNTAVSEQSKRWQSVKVCHNAEDPMATVHEHNVHKRTDELVHLVRRAVDELGSAAWPVCTRNVFVHKNALKFRPAVLDNSELPSSASWPLLLDGDSAMRYPAIYGLLCTVFEWFRVAVDGQWAVGPYDMRYWDFMHGVAPVPYVIARDKNAPHYTMCTRTGFRRWTAAGMLHLLRARYSVSANTLAYLELAVSST